METLTIGDKTVGKGHPVFIIAEAGVNHNGSLELAKKLVDAAQASGADAVKFQNFKPEEVVTADTGMAQYQEQNTGKSQSQLEMIRGFALSSEDFEEIAAHCKEKKIIFMSTPHGGFQSVDLLKKLHVPALKFGSGDLTNLPVLAYAAKLQVPIIISTGMATMPEIEEAVSIIREQKNDQIVVLQCTTDYPTAPEEVNLRAMQSIERATKTLVGLSDHTKGYHASAMAVALGASVLEKHITFDKGMEGPDHKASLDPEEFTEFVRIIREAEAMLGSEEKKPSPSEMQYMPIVRKSVVARVDIKEGEKLSEENMAIKRPGTGLHPRNYFTLLEKMAKRNIKADELFEESDL